MSSGRREREIYIELDSDQVGRYKSKIKKVHLAPFFRKNYVFELPAKLKRKQATIRILNLILSQYF